MTSPAPAEQRYRERVARAVAAIVADPMAGHRLEDLARLAHFSPFHFHRVYHCAVGETVAATLRRARLALAARLLEEGHQSITQIALAVGYDSPQAFTRAFGRFAGQSPRAFQRQMHSTLLDPGATPRGPAPAVQVVEHPARRLRALRHRGPASTIPHTHRRLHQLVGDRPVAEWLGVSRGDPGQPGNFCYHAAVDSPAPWPEDSELEWLDLPAGRYARHCLVGPYSHINAAITTLHARWLPVSGYEPDERPTLERYLNSPRTARPEALRTELLIPIRRASPP